MGDPLTLASLGLSAIGTGKSLFPGNTQAYDSIVMVNVNDPNVTTDGGTYSRMSPAEKKAWMTQDQYAMKQEQQQQQAVYDTEKGKLDKTLGDIGALDISGELENYEKDLFNSFMETASPAVRQWAFERGVAGGTPDADLMAKTIAKGTEQASLGKYQVQNQMNTQKENAKTSAMNAFNTKTALPTNLIEMATKGLMTGNGMTTGGTAGADWGNILKGLSTDLSTYSMYDTLFNKNKSSGKDELSLDNINPNDNKKTWADVQNPVTIGSY